MGSGEASRDPRTRLHGEQAAVLRGYSERVRLVDVHRDTRRTISSSRSPRRTLHSWRIVIRPSAGCHTVRVDSVLTPSAHSARACIGPVHAAALLGLRCSIAPLWQ